VSLPIAIIEMLGVVNIFSIIEITNDSLFQEVIEQLNIFFKKSLFSNGKI